MAARVSKSPEAEPEKWVYRPGRVNDFNPGVYYRDPNGHEMFVAPLDDCLRYMAAYGSLQRMASVFRWDNLKTRKAARDLAEFAMAAMQAMAGEVSA